MSRHLLLSKENHKLFVGWDNPLQTFFAQHFVDFDTPEETLFWSMGESEGEYPNLLGFVEALREEGFEVPVQMYEVLKKDYENRREQTPLQKRMNEFFRQMNSR